jgi:hypothetical protein
MQERVRVDYDENRGLSKSGLAVHLVINGKSYFFPLSCTTVYEKRNVIYMPESMAVEKGLV